METTIAVYSEYVAQLEQLKKDNSSLVFDYESKDGNKSARSHIYKLRQTKSAVEKARKEEKAASLEYGRKVDAEAKSIISEIEDMILVHQKPIDEIEKREKDRIQRHKDHIQEMVEVSNQSEHPDGRALTSSEYHDAIEYLEGIVIDDSWEEFITEAAQIKDSCLSVVKKRYSERLKYEKEQEELIELRKKQEEAAQREHDERIAREAKARATAEAEEASKREREAAERRELELRLATEKAEREKAEAEKRAAIAEQEAINNAKRAEDERKKKEKEEAEKREKDKRHNAKINNLAVDSIVKECSLSEEQAKLVVIAIAQRKVPNVSISY